MGYDDEVVDFSTVADNVLLPDGEYVVELVSAKEGMTKSGNPKVDLQWGIAEGPYRGRMCFDMAVIDTKSEMAMVRLKQMLKALNGDQVPPPLTVGQRQAVFNALLGKFIAIKVVQRPAKDGYDAKNGVNKYAPFTGDVLPSPTGLRSRVDMPEMSTAKIEISGEEDELTVGADGIPRDKDGNPVSL